MSLFDNLNRNKKESGILESVLSSEIVQEIEAALHFCISSGFFSETEIYEQAMQAVKDIYIDNDIAIPPDSIIKQMIQRFAADTSLPANGSDNYIRLRNVFDLLNRERIIAIHFAGYTLDDGFDEVDTVFDFMKSNNIPRRGYCFYHQQDIERAMDKSIQCLYLAFHSLNGDVQLATEVGERISELLAENGFDVEWDNSPDSRIKINNFLWDKKYDGEDYGADRAVRIMRDL